MFKPFPVHLDLKREIPPNAYALAMSQDVLTTEQESTDSQLEGAYPLFLSCRVFPPK